MRRYEPTIAHVTDSSNSGKARTLSVVTTQRAEKAAGGARRRDCDDCDSDRCLRTADGSASAAFTDRIGRSQIAYDGLPLRGPYHFFASTSWSITLPRDKFATNRLSFAFSSWRCLNWRTCSDSGLAYRCFH